MRVHRPGEPHRRRQLLRDLSGVYPGIRRRWQRLGGEAGRHHEPHQVAAGSVGHLLHDRRRHGDLLRAATSWVTGAVIAIPMPVNGLCAQAASTQARRLPMSYWAAQDREGMAPLQRQLFEAHTAVNRFGNNVNKGWRRCTATGQPPI